MSVLIIKHINRPEDERVVILEQDRPVFIGREPASDVQLPSPVVSRQHAVIILKNHVCGIKDLASSNGTFINGIRISKSKRLRDGDKIQIADFIIEYRLDDKNATTIMDLPDIIRTAGINIQPVISPAISSSQTTAKSRESEEHPVPDDLAVSEPARFDEPAAGAQPSPVKPTHDTVRIEDDIIQQPEGIAEELEETPLPDDTPYSFNDEASLAGFGAEPEMAGLPEETVATPELEPESELVPEPPHVPEKKIAAPPPAAAKPAARSKPALPKARPALPRQKAKIADRPPPAAVASAKDEEDEEVTEQAKAKDAGNLKAAAEAGLVGEFTPDLDDDANGQSPQEEADPSAFPLTDQFHQIIDVRLSLYSFMSDLSQERAAIMERTPGLPDAVKSELSRQDRELVKMPSAKQARGMIEKREAKRKALAEKTALAEKNGEPIPPQPTQAMLEAEDLADTQWRFIIESEEEALTAVYDEALSFTRDEPLVEQLSQVDIDFKFMMGGGIYYLALENLLAEAKEERKSIKERLAAVDGAQQGKKGFRLFGGGGDDDEDEEEEEENAAPKDDPEELAELDAILAGRVSAINQELVDLEKKLIAEFWRVYIETAVKFIPDADTMDWSVRAFLRHGAIAFKPWWMPEEVRQHIYYDCKEEIKRSPERLTAETDIVYADEYLAAVANLECTPALDENLELNERNSPNWKADKALRRMIFARRQIFIMEGLVGVLDGKVNELQGEIAKFDDRIAKVLPGAKQSKQQKRELQQEQQRFRVEIAKVKKVRDKIKDETLASLKESVREVEERFESGELPKPSVEFLISRECEAVHRIGRLLANLKERFLPLVVRDYKLNTDAMNDRISVVSEVAFIEKRDPGVFLETIVPSKKKKDRVDIRVSPTVVIIPSAGLLCYSWNPRGGQENGRLAMPTCFIRQRIRERQITYLFSDFRWDTSKAAAGMDIMMSETIVAAFMTVRWDWRKRSKDAREKGLIFNEQNDRTNWRRVYESYIQTAMESGKKLYQRNYDFYERIIGKYFDLPEGLPLLKK